MPIPVIQRNSQEPVVLSSEGLPSFATLTGTTLVFEPPAEAVNTRMKFMILATSGGLTSRNIIVGYVSEATP